MSESKDIIEDAAEDADVLEEVLASVTPVQPPEHLRAKVMNSVRDKQSQTITLRGNEGWRELAPGIDYKLLYVDTVARTKSFLLKAAPGMSMPGHSHHSYEECLVLEGAFSIGDLHLKAGDFHGASAGSEHDESRTETGVLVYLKSALQDYPEVCA